MHEDQLCGLKHLPRRDGIRFKTIVVSKSYFHDDQLTFWLLPSDGHIGLKLMRTGSVAEARVNF